MIIWPFDAYALDNRAAHWYFKPAKTQGELPAFDADLAELARYDAYCMGDTSRKRIYLTFDAGYENDNVAKTAQILNKHGIKGAFFVLEHFIRANTELAKSLADSGHLLCNHTLKHRNISTMSDPDVIKSQISPLEDICRDLTGHEMAKFFRPPEGAYSMQSIAYMQQLGYKTIFWSGAHADWDESKQPNPETSFNKLIERTHPGMILLLHPTSSTNAAILERLILRWQEMGYTFGTLYEIGM